MGLAVGRTADLVEWIADSGCGGVDFRDRRAGSGRGTANCGRCGENFAGRTADLVEWIAYSGCGGVDLRDRRADSGRGTANSGRCGDNIAGGSAYLNDWIANFGCGGVIFVGGTADSVDMKGNAPFAFSVQDKLWLMESVLFRLCRKVLSDSENAANISSHPVTSCRCPICDCSSPVSIVRHSGNSLRTQTNSLRRPMCHRSSRVSGYTFLISEVFLLDGIVLPNLQRLSVANR